MKLSEAILLGSTLSPQGMGMYEDAEGRRCALGSALAAVGETVRPLPEDESDETIRVDKLLSKHWPQIDLPLYDAMCPDDCGGQCLELGCLIVHLNDDHHWSREKIASHVAQIEPPEAVEVGVPDSRNAHTELCGQGPRILSLEAPTS
jgi:hypothetical protein